MLTITFHQLRVAAIASCAALALPLMLTLSNPASRLRGGHGGEGFDWMPGSFAVMGAMLFVTILGVQLAARSAPTPTVKMAAIVGVLAVFGLIWAELAVDGVSQVVALLAVSETCAPAMNPAFMPIRLA